LPPVLPAAPTGQNPVFSSKRFLITYAVFLATSFTGSPTGWPNESCLLRISQKHFVAVSTFSYNFGRWWSIRGKPARRMWILSNPTSPNLPHHHALLEHPLHTPTATIFLGAEGGVEILRGEQLPQIRDLASKGVPDRSKAKSLKAAAFIAPLIAFIAFFGISGLGAQRAGAIFSKPLEIKCCVAR